MYIERRVQVDKKKNFGERLPWVYPVKRKKGE